MTACAAFLFLLFVFLKPFYFFESGALGIGDMSLCVSFLLLVIKRIKDRKGRLWDTKDYFLYLFLLCVIGINGFYYIKIGNTQFIRYTLFICFNVGAVWTFRFLSQSERFLRWMNWILKTGLALQIILYVFGWGRIYREGWGDATRYMGSFNNPNQMAYIIFLMTLLIYLYDKETQSKWLYVYLAMGGFLIGVTESTGVFLGWGVLLACDVLIRIENQYRRGKISKRTIQILGIGSVALLAAALIVIWPPSDFVLQEREYDLITRIQEKIHKYLQGGLRGLVYDRGAEKVLLYPQYLLFGSGEGVYVRFPLSDWKSEIHSTLFSLWFCYGTIPLGILLTWIYKNMKGLQLMFWPVYIALFIECFTVINYRQPFFWMLLVYASILTQQKATKVRRKELTQDVLKGNEKRD